MKITKNSQYKGEKSALVLKMLDIAVSKIGMIPFDIDFTVGSKTKVEVKEDKLIIVLDYFDAFVQESDKNGIYARILFLIHLAITKKSFLGYPEILQKILSGRSMCKLFKDQAFYAMFIDTMSVSGIKDFEHYIEALVPYIVFSCVDKYNADLLYSGISRHIDPVEGYDKKAKKFLAAVCRPLDTPRAVKEAVNCYTELQKIYA
ncbi:MAG: hypothetical protein HY513_01645 [Candidatus Aenigmarchaeota archaeon]|nr:hypothetical protein [Candidatus Aenigmarchaeota archaeon]